MQSLDETLPRDVSVLSTERSQRDEEMMESVKTADARSSLSDAVAIDRYVLSAGAANAPTDRFVLGATERNEHEVPLEVIDIAS